MRGRSSKREQEAEEEMEIDKISKLKEEPHLSSAYIRSLVKQLTLSRAKDQQQQQPMNPKDNSCGVDGDSLCGPNMTKSSENHQQSQQQPQQPPQQQHKKQVRRRLHTSRLYQERLLNMAEARREIVTALKFHRAAMKQASEQKEQQQQQQQQHQQQQASLQLPPPCFEPEARMKSRRNPRTNPSNTLNFNNLDNFSYTSFQAPLPPPPSFPSLCPYSSWPNPILPPSTATDDLNFPLPNQTLGLNLNFQDFNNIDTTLYSSSSTSSSSSPSLSIATEELVPPAARSGEGSVADAAEGGLHQVMDDEEMAEIRSIGEQHQMEWNDTMNLVTSAWWFKFSKTMDLGPEEKPPEDDVYNPFDQVMEFPSWLNPNDATLQQHFNDYCAQDYFHDPALPCMDIGEIDGMDGEWLS